MQFNEIWHILSIILNICYEKTRTFLVVRNSHENWEPHSFGGWPEIDCFPGLTNLKKGSQNSPLTGSLRSPRTSGE